MPQTLEKETAAAPERTTTAKTHDTGRNNTPPPNGKPGKFLIYSERLLPKAEEAARQIIHSWILYGPKQKNHVDPCDFPGIHTSIAEGVLDAMLGNGARDFPGVLAYFTEAPDPIRAELIECTQGFAPQPEDCGKLIVIIRNYAHERKFDLLAGKLNNVLQCGGDPAPVLEEIANHQKQAIQSDQGDVFREMLAERLFDAENHPPLPVPILKLDGKTISTPGNILALQAGIKSGKTTVVGAFLGAIMNGGRHGCGDTLGFSGENEAGHAVLHFDTEQSRYDHDRMNRIALTRAGLEAPPSWYRSFCLTDLSQANRDVAIETAIADAVGEFGGIFAIVLDGVADICRDPNNPEEAFALVDKLHAAAIKYDCAIIAVIHENPGSEKTRGHLGSQLARKAETNLRLQKDPASGVTTIWADYARHCHISKNEGVCFSWSDSLRMHVSRGSAGEIKAAEKTQKFREEAEAAFGDSSSLSYSALVAAIMQAVGFTSAKTAEKRVTTYQAEGIVIRSQSGSYSLK